VTKVKRLIKKIAGWVQLETERRLAVGDYGKGDDSKETYFQRGVLSIDTLRNAQGFSGENRQWTDNGDGTRSFGNYSEERWNAFLDDIEQNGIQEPIVVNVNSDGSMKIWEGNHRIEAAIQLGLTEIPAKVFYMGQSQQEHMIQ
jgi:hypothetical protein